MTSKGNFTHMYTDTHAHNLKHKNNREIRKNREERDETMFGGVLYICMFMWIGVYNCMCLKKAENNCDLLFYVGCGDIFFQIKVKFIGLTRVAS